MISTYVLILIFNFSLISTYSITTYRNARFEPFDNQSIISNLSSINSQDLCICHCRWNETCLTVVYSAYYRSCMLYRAQLNEGQLRVMTTLTNSSVMSIRNRTIPVSTTSPLQTTAGTTASMTTAVVTCTTLVTFDNISGQTATSGVIPNTYSNLNWTNAEYINTSLPGTTGGYRNGVVSRPFVLYNTPGTNLTLVTANGTRFSFDGMRLTSAWRESLLVIVKTIRNGIITTIGNFSLMPTYFTPIFCNFCTDVDTMTFESGGGIINTIYPQNGSEFIVDNLCISFGR